jgi:hypothetical protein
VTGRSFPRYKKAVFYTVHVNAYYDSNADGIGDFQGAQAVERDLREFKGAIPIEMFGGNPFPRIGDLPYFLTLGPYHFFWFSLRRL